MLVCQEEGRQICTEKQDKKQSREKDCLNGTEHSKIF